MSYDIYFIKRKDLTSQNIEIILESGALKTDKHYVSKQQMLEIKDKLIQQGLKFEVFEKQDEEYLELNFPSCQVSMFNNQFAISIPYWDNKHDDGINHEVKIITNTLLDNGFTGYDPQTEEFIVSKHAFRKTFTESKNGAENTRSVRTENNFNYTYVGIGIAIPILGIIIWKILK